MVAAVKVVVIFFLLCLFTLLVFVEVFYFVYLVVCLFACFLQCGGTLPWDVGLDLCVPA